MNYTTVTPTSQYYDYDYEAGHATTMYFIIIATVMMYCLAFVLGTIGNGLVIWITGFKMKKTVNTIWFLNLAVADFLFTAFLPFTIAYTAMGFHWPFGRDMCRLNNFVIVLNMFASIFLLTIISLDRCLSVMAAVWAVNWRTPRRAEVACLLVWVLACCCSIPFAAYRDTVVYGLNMTICYYNESGLEAYDKLVLFRFFMGFLFPLIIIVCSYVAIGYRFHTIQRKKSLKPFRVILAVILTFFFCWVPFHIFQLLELKFKGVEAVMHGATISASLGFLNSCMNPILYVCMCQDFRKKFRRSFLLVLESAFLEEHLLSFTRRSTAHPDSFMQVHQKNTLFTDFPDEDNGAHESL
uniref:Si:ch211-137j23.6 n=1 Tax=Lepisosteus oculatus TaxID=7918 RepID=W5NNR0_LEPOC|nr:PREDICTED: chemokine-like receptor 1 [Lepisosteus oculatus]XP_015191870.1 PREDICTED: chemokine-like receptor 1 [Lepisosteus oculatus]